MKRWNAVEVELDEGRNAMNPLVHVMTGRTQSYLRET